MEVLFLFWWGFSFHSAWINWLWFVGVKSERDVHVLSNADKPQTFLQTLRSAFSTPIKGTSSALIKHLCHSVVVLSFFFFPVGAVPVSSPHTLDTSIF